MAYPIIKYPGSAGRWDGSPVSTCSSRSGDVDGPRGTNRAGEDVVRQVRMRKLAAKDVYPPCWVAQAEHSFAAKWSVGSPVGGFGFGWL